MFPQGLIKGLGITGKRAVGRGVCEMYPQRPKVLPPKSRTFLTMRATPDGAPLCRACLACQTTCPDHVIRIERDAEDRKKVVSFTIDSGRCTFCGMCQEGCTFGALTFTGDFERATYDKGALTYALVRDSVATDACVTVEPAEEPATEGGEDVG